MVKDCFCKMNKTRGFTLVELLVVIAILGLISSIIIVATNSVRAKARDTKRVAQLDQVRKGLEIYYSKYGVYPQFKSTNIVQNWSDMLDALKSEGIISMTDEQPVVRERKSLFGFIQEAFAALNTSIQDPLYPQYSFGYMPAADPPYGNFRIRGHLEFLDSPYLRNSLTGKFLYSDENSGPNACDISLGFFCTGPSSDFTAFDPGKPVIYLYPEKKQEVTVKVLPKKIEESVPLYKNGWRVIASPDGTIYNLDDGKIYPYLFWEGKSNEPIVDKGKGFVVKNNRVETFLLEKLKELGLNQKEASDFIEYWAPRLETKAYVYIYFMPQADFNKLVPIEVFPKPDTIIRIYMLFSSLDKPIDVREQEIAAPPQRKGFTVVEWGGDRSEIR